MLGLFITLLISIILTSISAIFTPIKILPFIFIGTIIIQYIIWYIFINFKKNQLLFLNQQLKLLQIDILNKHTCHIKCANCNYEYDTTALINEENISICPSCRQKNKLLIDIKPVIVLENIQDINAAQNEIFDKLSTINESRTIRRN